MKRKVLVGIGCFFMAAIFVYGLMYARSSSLVENMLERAGYPSAKIEGMRVFFDGIVIDKITLDEGKSLETIYMQANPWQQILHDPSFISVGKADLAIGTLFKHKIGFINDIPFTIDNVILHAPSMPDVALEMKQSSPTSALIYFKSKAPEARLKGQGEFFFENDILTNINLDFSQISLDSKELRTRRGDGWLSFVYKDRWLVTGELGSGYADLSGLKMADASLTINGAASAPVWNLTGKEQKTNEPVAIEYAEKVIKTYFKNEEFEHKTYGFSEDFAAIEKDVRSVKPLQVVVVTKAIPRLKSAKKIEVDKSSDSLQILELVKKPFDELVQNTFFEGLVYSEDLMIIDVPCPSAAMTACWSARARGGILSFETIPSYFTRMKDYAASNVLRKIFQDLRVKTLTLQGENNQAQQLIVTGTSNAGQPVHIELSVSDVN